MQPSSPQPLANVVDAFIHELDEVESIFASCKGSRSVAAIGYTYRPSEDGCLVSLFDAWNRFLKDLVLTGAEGDVQGLSGSIYIQPQPRTRRQAFTDLNTNKRGHNFRITNNEPRWYDPACLTDIMSFLTLPNDMVVIGALVPRG